MYSKQLKVGLLLLYFSVDQKVVCASMHLLLHPITIFLYLACTATTSPGFLPRLYNGRKTGCRPFFLLFSQPLYEIGFILAFILSINKSFPTALIVVWYCFYNHRYLLQEYIRGSYGITLSYLLCINLFFLYNFHYNIEANYR